VDQPVDDNKLAQGAISGMVQSLGDPHTRYMTPAEYEITQADQSGDLEGIGAYVEGYEGYLRIVSPFPGSPAEEVGLLPGDVIIKVDGVDMEGLGEAEIISHVRGPAGSTVHLTIYREGHEDYLEFDVVREKFSIPSVESEMLADQVAYIKINDFGDKTDPELRAALKDLLGQKPVGMVLDLRGNPGGYLTTAIEVASQFISDGIVMRERQQDGSETTYTAKSGGLATEIPLVVLIDAGSASASEIVAGAIQDRERGLIVGQTSYGKGSVQQWIPLKDDAGAVAITVARWLTPNGRTIHKQGITPDVSVKRTEDDRTADLDPQLDKAVELIKNGGTQP
jgi:carboxyl-terminal processing protease